MATKKGIARKKGVGGNCAWAGCAKKFEGDMPAEWVWLVAYWAPQREVDRSLDDITSNLLCMRDAALCGNHAQMFDGMLKT